MWDDVLARAEAAVPSITSATDGKKRQACISPYTLSAESLQVYRSIVSNRTDAELRDLVNRAAASNGVSARSMHAFVVKYASTIDLHVFIRRDGSVSLVPDDDVVDVVNVHASYANMMSLYGKALFDAFGRGKLVSHEQSDGSILNLSLCRLNFFMWSSGINLPGIMSIFAVDFKRFQDSGKSDIKTRSIVFNNVSINAVVPSIAFLDMRHDAIIAAGIAAGIDVDVDISDVPNADAAADLLELLIDVHDDAVLLADISEDVERRELEEVQMKMIECAERVRMVRPGTPV
jgi:hypothetical protein